MAESDTESLSLSGSNDEGNSEISNSKQDAFVKLVQENPILLKKSQTPVVKKQKAAAMKRF